MKKQLIKIISIPVLISFLITIGGDMLSIKVLQPKQVHAAGYWRYKQTVTGQRYVCGAKRVTGPDSDGYEYKGGEHIFGVVTQVNNGIKNYMIIL